jgi:hypothetical protein
MWSGACSFLMSLVLALWRGTYRLDLAPEGSITREDDLATYGTFLRGRGWAGIKPRRPTPHSQQA